jgi:hypothetical protein
VAALPVTHVEHSWQLQAVHLDDGVTLHEYACAACGAVDYR